MIGEEELRRRFNHHPPDAERARRHISIRQGAFELADLINVIIPDESREKSLAITKVEEAMMWANAAIARQP